MALKFEKALVMERLRNSLDFALEVETREMRAFDHDQETFYRKLESWQQTAKKWADKRIKRGESLNVYGAPNPPGKPDTPKPKESKRIKRYIGIVECIAGEQVVLSKDILEGIGGYLS
ncbi:hypothetical protein LCGC14_1625410 [marine sediment metagenome]|uniref:Uncharacterized protein n=1 Tax=marine sediment metagenome TaxID=412755 RepID=A0A0F9KJR5_9ZZZZ